MVTAFLDSAYCARGLPVSGFSVDLVLGLARRRLVTFASLFQELLTPTRLTSRLQDSGLESSWCIGVRSKPLVGTTVMRG